MKDKTLYLIGNAHIDPVWLWQWQEGFQETKATFRAALDRIKEYDEFIFTSGSAATYEWVEKNDSKMFNEIKQRVDEGRWIIVGGWWIEPDCNIPCGESFVRQGLYGQRYFKSKFGITAKVGFNVDSFGHFAMMPQILKKSGMDYYVMMRPMPNEKGLPGRLFFWESDDGSRVLTYRILFEYCTWPKELDNHVKRCSVELKEPYNDGMCFYGVGNHGGGPTIENIESLKRMSHQSELPNLVFSSPDAFFDEMARKGSSYPVVHDELQHHASGCYSAHSGVKNWNRKAECRLMTAEKFAILADWLTGQPYLREELGLAWKNVLFNQFHDILAGTSIEPAYEDARNQFGEAISIADRSLNYALQSISWNINIDYEENMKPIVVFNPHSWNAKVNVEIECRSFDDNHILIDEKGNQVKHQKVKPLATANGRNRLSFVAEIPSMGYRTYRLLPDSLKLKSVVKQNIVKDNSIESERFYIEFDPQKGYIKKLYDKKHMVEVFSGDAAKPIIIDDKSDTWSHNKFRFDKVIGAFEAKQVKLVEHGDVKSVIRVTSEYGNSKLMQDFTVYCDLEYIDVKVTVDWREQNNMLKFIFPVNLIFTRQTYEIPYGHIEREHNGEEEPGQSWIDISGITRDSGIVYGISIANDAKYSYSINNKEMAITVLRSPIYAHHDPLIPDPSCEYSFIDQGVQTFNYRLVPHCGYWEDADTVKLAAELNQSPIAIIETYHSGLLPMANSFLSVDKKNVIVSAMKKAEESDDIIFRLYETTKTETEATVTLPEWNRTFTTKFGQCEIKTFRVPKEAHLPITEVNMLEW